MGAHGSGQERMRVDGSACEWMGAHESGWECMRVDGNA